VKLRKNKAKIPRGKSCLLSDAESANFIHS
jgi:hypothetical protein